MPCPSYLAACGLLLAAPAVAGNYPPPPGPYVNPAVQQWLAARTEPLLASARRDAAAEAPQTGNAAGEASVSTWLISARADQQPAPESWTKPLENTPEQTDFRPVDPRPKPAALGPSDPVWYAEEPLRWREQLEDPVTQNGVGQVQSHAAPGQGLLDPLPAGSAYHREARSALRRPEFATTEPATGQRRSTEELLALYLDYGTTGPAADPRRPGNAVARNQPAAPKPESRRYYYRPTGTTFEFRALEREPREPIQAGSGNAADWNFPNPKAASRR